MRRVCAANPNTVVVLSNGAPVLMPWIEEVGALVECYLGGQAGGAALADVLFGHVNPCGKLAETFPLAQHHICLLYTSPSPRDRQKSRMPSSA